MVTTGPQGFQMARIDAILQQAKEQGFSDRDLNPIGERSGQASAARGAA